MDDDATTAGRGCGSRRRRSGAGAARAASWRARSSWRPPRWPSSYAVGGKAAPLRQRRQRRRRAARGGRAAWAATCSSGRRCRRSPSPTTSPALTAIANDYGYDQVFARQVEALGRPATCALGLSTSGTLGERARRPAIAAARARALTLGVTGAARRADAAGCATSARVPAAETPRIQEGTMIVLHTICELVERELFAADDAGRADGVPRPRRHDQREGPGGRLRHAAAGASVPARRGGGDPRCWTCRLARWSWSPTSAACARGG